MTGAFENQKEFLSAWPLRSSNCNDDANNYCLLCNFAIILYRCVYTLQLMFGFS